MSQIFGHSVSEIISVLSGFCILIYGIFQVAKKAIENMAWYKKTKEEKEVQEKEKRWIEWKEFYFSAKKEFEELDAKRTKELYDEFNEQFMDKYTNKIIKEIQKTDREQNLKIQKLITTSNDILRKELVSIYYTYLPQKKIPVFRKKSFMKLYEDYHSQGGNSFVEDIYKQIAMWEVVDTDEEALGEVKN